MEEKEEKERKRGSFEAVKPRFDESGIKSNYEVIFGELPDSFSFVVPFQTPLTTLPEKKRSKR